MEEQLNVEVRESLGKRRTRQLRKAGLTPAVLYGQGEESVSLSVGTDAFGRALRHGSRLMKLSGAVSSNALVRELQWDTFGTYVLHVDFMRVKADQRVEVEVTIELRGDAPGIREGGIVEQLVRSVKIEVLATSIPDRLHVNVNDLKLGGTIALKEIEDLAEGAKLLDDPDRVAVHCVMPTEEKEESDAADGVEPELIGGKPEDGDEKKDG